MHSSPWVRSDLTAFFVSNGRTDRRPHTGMTNWSEVLQMVFYVCIFSLFNCYIHRATDKSVLYWKCMDRTFCWSRSMNMSISWHIFWQECKMGCWWLYAGLQRGEEADRLHGSHDPRWRTGGLRGDGMVALEHPRGVPHLLADALRHPRLRLPRLVLVPRVGCQHIGNAGQNPPRPRLRDAALRTRNGVHICVDHQQGSSHKNQLSLILPSEKKVLLPLEAVAVFRETHKKFHIVLISIELSFTITSKNS